MPNQQNFPDPLDQSNFQRPSRISQKDLDLIRHVDSQILFGTSDKDVVELWIYNTDGAFAGHINLGPTDMALSLTTLVDNTGPIEVLNIDLKSACNRMGISPGRYGMVANFFRNEVGSEAGAKLYISQISDNRLEMQLTPVAIDDSILHDIYEWVIPSVPKEYASGLVEQLFGKAIDSPTTHILTIDKIDAMLNVLIPGTTNRIAYAGMRSIYEAEINSILTQMYPMVLNLMAADVFNLNIQQLELQNYINKALTTVISGMVQKGQIDNRFAVI